MGFQPLNSIDVQFRCVRQCTECKTKMEISADNLMMRRNYWTLWVKKEFFTICVNCGKKIHDSKKYLNDDIMNYIQQNK